MTPGFSRCAISAVLSVSVLIVVGCGTSNPILPRAAPIVKQQHFAKGENALKLVAVMPFYPNFSVTRPRDDSEFSGGEAAELLTRFFTEAVTAAGIPTVTAVDLQIAFEAEGVITPRLDPRAAARVAAKDFGATTVVLGELFRFRDRVGERLGAARSASVSFEVTLYEAPSGFKLWSGRFDETQRPLTDNLFNARRYPGGGSRWLSSTELAQWGAREMAFALGHRP